MQNEDGSYRSIRGRKFDTYEAALQDNREFADEQEASDQENRVREAEFTTHSGCQVWVFIAVICLTLAFPALWVLWFGLAALYFGRSR